MRNNLVNVRESPYNIRIFVERLDNARVEIRNQHPMLLAMVGPDEPISMANNREYAMHIATDFEVPS